MKRFLLFAYADYYPSGGMNDFVKDFDSIEELKKWADNEVDNAINPFTCDDRKSPLMDENDNLEVYDQMLNKFVEVELPIVEFTIENECWYKLIRNNEGKIQKCIELEKAERGH